MPNHISSNRPINTLSHVTYGDVLRRNSKDQLIVDGPKIRKLKNLQTAIKQNFKSQQQKLKLGKQLLGIAQSKLNNAARINSAFDVDTMTTANRYATKLSHIDAPIQSYCNAIKEAENVKNEIAWLVSSMAVVGQNKNQAVLFTALQEIVKNYDKAKERDVDSQLDEFIKAAASFSKKLESFQDSVTKRNEKIGHGDELKASQTF